MTPQQIADEVNKIIEEIPQEERRKMGAINWGDLSCRCITEIRNVWPEMDDEQSLSILIEEASHDNFEFHNYIYDKLCELGIRAEIVTEW